jgi:hypothetical protein
MALQDINTTSETAIVQSLKHIATDLIEGYKLSVNNYIFSFIDLEIYFYHPLHPDEYALSINHDRPLGELEIHDYGVDISLGNDRASGYGGILIRGLYDENAGMPIKKSNVVRLIFNRIEQGRNTININPEGTRWTNTFCSKRLNLGDPLSENKEKYYNSKYRFLAKSRDIFDGYADKENIFRFSDLDDNDVKDLLGYSLKR